MPEPAEKLVEALRASMTEVARLRQENRRLAEAAREPIAIIGMACRLPGAVAGPEDLWRLVIEERDAVAPLPADRGWDGIEALGPRPPEGGFLEAVADFDPGFFGISPREAVAMDPQQRQLLEIAWETVERAGIDPSSLRGSRTGVYIGSAQPGYFADPRDEDFQRYAVTASVASVISGRVSYVLGFQGPAATIDTACSSSLVAMHLAATALRNGECGLALAGGVAVMPNLATFYGFGHQQALAGDGRCKAFAAAADGMTLSEGVGLVLLERLSEARKNGHQVLAVIRGSAVNQDGASNGLTAPNGPSQQRVIRDALANAGLAPEQVDAVEAHGTGTSLGDPIEAQALIATYGRDRAPDRPLWLGSLKSNIGHAQAAAGIASVIKCVLALRHDTLPKSLHIDRPSPHIDWDAGAVRLLEEARPWPESGQPHRIGVSSFGISGTNAHLILEQAPDTQAATAAASSSTPSVLAKAPLPWLVSAKTDSALRAQARRLLAFTAERPEAAPADVADALASTRTAFDRRAALIADNRSTLLTGLLALAEGTSAPGLIRGGVELAGKTAFVIAAEDPAWQTSATSASQASPVFADSFRECAEALALHNGWSLLDVLRAEPSAPPKQRIDVLKAGTFAAAVAYAALWRASGVTPSALLGEGVGAIAAACISGAVDLQAAARMLATDTLPNDEDLPVRVEKAVESGHAYFVQIGPGPTLSDRISESLDESILVPPRAPDEALVSMLARAYVLGVPVDWKLVHRPGTTKPIGLPTYAFDHKRYWLPTTVPAPPEPTPTPAPAAPTSHVPAIPSTSAASPEQEDALLELIRQEVGALLDYPSAEDVPPKRTFQDLGFDSIASIDLQVKLKAATGLALPATVAFDYPTPTRLARHLAAQLYGESTEAETESASAGLPNANPVRDDTDPVVVVGMSCRLPGGVETPEEFWRVLADGQDLVAPMPEDRGWDATELAAAEASMPAIRILREGGFIRSAGDFDAGFFDICDDEALVLDPQHRLLLELSWEALENAGADPVGLRGEQIGVYVGTFYQAYPADVRQVPAPSMRYLGGGASPAIAAGRVAYTLGFEGPALALDAACTSSALAVHLACQAVRAGECSMALAGGVTVLAHPIAFPDLVGAAAPDGRCKSFASAADGTGYGEGAGMIAVERLSEARRRGHRVLAVIKGSAANHNGESNGLTAPNGPSQQRVIRQALAAAGVAPGEVDAVEGHGAGTSLGDPIEAQALMAAYGGTREADRPLWLGSFKSNLGHPHAASGVIGVIKMVLALRHGLLPKTLHVDAPSAKADWSPGTVSLLTEARPWPRENRPRRAGVSSFGSSGSKVHLILEEAPEPAAPEPPSPGTPVPWPLSAKTPEALHAQAHRLRAHLGAHPELTPTDVARALAARSAFDHRAVLHGTTMEDLIAGLERLEHGQLALNLPPEVEESPIAAAARAFVDGKDVDWSPFLPAADAAPVELPGYAFQRKRYWIPA